MKYLIKNVDISEILLSLNIPQAGGHNEILKYLNKKYGVDISEILLAFNKPQADGWVVAGGQ